MWYIYFDNIRQRVNVEMIACRRDSTKKINAHTDRSFHVIMLYADAILPWNFNLIINCI